MIWSLAASAPPKIPADWSGWLVLGIIGVALLAGLRKWMSS